MEINSLYGVELENMTSSAYIWPYAGRLYFNENSSNTFYQCGGLNMSLQAITNSISRNKIVNAYNMFGYCEKLSGSPVWGTNITNAGYMYYECQNLTGQPVCGPNVTDARSMYYNCQYLTGWPTVGDNVTHAEYMYYNCRNITGRVEIPRFVVNAECMFKNCKTLNRVTLDSTTNLNNAYEICYACSNLKYASLQGRNVVNAANAFAWCYNLRQSAKCGANVVNARNMYYYCNSLIGAAECGKNVQDAYQMYYMCSNLTAGPNVGANVINAAYMYYQCFNMQGMMSIQTSGKIQNAAYMFYRCSKIQGGEIRLYSSCTNVYQMFFGKNNSNRYNVYVVKSSTLDTALRNNSIAGRIVGTNLTWTTMTNGYYNSTYGIYVYNNLA